MDVNRLGQIFNLIDFNKVKDGGKTTDIKDLNEVVLFDDKNIFNSDLLSEDKFVDAFVKVGNNSFNEQELKYLYDAVAELDGNYGLSRADLTMLAEMGNKTDKTDTQGNKINEADIIAFLDKVEEELENLKNPTTPSAPTAPSAPGASSNPAKEPAAPVTTTKTETVYKKPAKMEETKTETIDGKQVTTHVVY